MIVLLDTTALQSDVEFKGAAWRVIVQAASSWDVRLFVPEVAVIEAVGCYQRSITDAQTGLDRWEDRHSNRLGQIGVQLRATAQATLSEAAETYPDRLRKTLSELNVTIIEPPDIPHLTLVERAASRRRPCDNKGDGYRDTLNWLTLLDVASKYPDEQVCWISNNTADFGSEDGANDFGSEDGANLHEDLLSELTAVAADSRVTWYQTLQDLVLALAAKHALESDLGKLQAQLHEQLLSEYIDQRVLNTASEMTLDARACGLPTATAAAKTIAIGPVRELHLTVRGGAAQGDTVVEFSLEAETSILITLPLDAPIDDTVWTRGNGSAASHAAGLKYLQYTGLITLDGYGRPTGAELTRATALDDDSGKAAWELLQGPSPNTGMTLHPNAFRILAEWDAAQQLNAAQRSGGPSRSYSLERLFSSGVGSTPNATATAALAALIVYLWRDWKKGSLTLPAFRDSGKQATSADSDDETGA